MIINYATLAINRGKNLRSVITRFKQNSQRGISSLLIALGVLVMVSYGWFFIRRCFKLVDLCATSIVSFDERISLNDRKELDHKLWSVYPPELRRISPSLMGSAGFLLFGVENIRNEIVISPQDGQFKAKIDRAEGNGVWLKGYFLFSYFNDELYLADGKCAHGPR